MITCSQALGRIVKILREESLAARAFEAKYPRAQWPGAHGECRGILEMCQTIESEIRTIRAKNRRKPVRVRGAG